MDYRISTSLCIINYFIVNIASPHNCTVVNRFIVISEGLAQFTSCALLLLRYGIILRPSIVDLIVPIDEVREYRVVVLYRDQIYVIVFMTALLSVNVSQ